MSNKKASVHKRVGRSLAGIIRKCFPVWSLRRELARIREELRNPGNKYGEHRQSTEADFEEISDALAEEETYELFRKADALHVSLREIPHPEGQASHWTRGTFGNEFLRPDSLCAFRKLVRQAETEHDKERREKIEVWTKLVVALTGLVGALIGLLAWLKR